MGHSQHKYKPGNYLCHRAFGLGLNRTNSHAGYLQRSSTKARLKFLIIWENILDLSLLNIWGECTINQSISLILTSLVTLL